jgi:hypothetical protein
MAVDLEKLNQHLSTRSYVEGWALTSLFCFVMIFCSGPCFQEATRHRCQPCRITSLPNFLTFSLTKINPVLFDHLLFHRYIPSQADVHVYNSITSQPDPSSLPHVARWYTHIKSYAPELADLPGSSAAGQAFVSAPPPSEPAPAADEEDDIDLFGDEDEDDAEAERVKAERVAAYNEKKANKPKTIAKVR